jgi:PAS domain S-box-containing protein
MQNVSDVSDLPGLSRIHVSALAAAVLTGENLKANLNERVTDVVEHEAHPGCCLTPAFRGVVGAASVAVVVVDREGFFIHANPSAEALLAYSLSEITKKHITEIVEADAPWVVSEFQHLVAYQTWSGSVLLRRRSEDLLKVSVNAFSRLLPDESAEHIAFLHPTQPEGPAIVRLPQAGLEYGLNVRELCLLHLIASGFDDGEIASILSDGDAPAVEAEKEAVRRKLAVSSGTEAAVKALRERLIA